MGMNPRTLRPGSTFTPRSISGLALWLDAADSGTLYTTDAGPVTAVSSPTEISGCALWLDGADATSMFDATSGGSNVPYGNVVARWEDKSGGGRHATATGTARPTLTPSGLNGRSVVTFDGSATQMQIDSTFLVTSNATILAVARRTSGSFGAVITSKGAGDTSPALQHSTGSWQINHAGNLSVIGFQAGYAVLSGTISAGATAAFANGLLQDSDASSGTLSSDAAKTYIGTYRAAIANVLAGEIAEIIVYNTALSTADRARVEAYLAAKWGISGVHAPATATNDPVGYWRDKSGNGRHATQGTGASRPTVSATALNGKRQLGLVSQHFRGPSTTWNGSATIYWVGRTGQATAGAMVFHDGSTFEQTDAFHGGWLNTQGVGAYGNGWGSGNAPRAESPSAWRNADIVAGVTLSSTESVARVNGATTSTVAALTGTLSQATATQFYVGRDSGAVWTNLNGSLAEILIYQPALSASQRARLERYLAAKWGITLAPQVSNADAQDWINRVYANGGTVSATTASAVNTFCNAIDTAGIRDRFYRLNLFCGNSDGDLNAVRTPLYRGPSLTGTQYGNAIDTNASFVPDDYAENNGLLGNSTTKWLNTGFTADTAGMTAESFHVSSIWPSYSHPANGNYYPISLINAGATTRLWLNANSSTTPTTEVSSFLGASGINFATKQIAATNGATMTGGLWVASRTSTTSLRLYNGATEQASNTTSLPDTTVPTLPMGVFARWNGTSTFGHSAMRLRGYSVGLGLTAEQVSDFNSAMATFQTAMGRT